MFAIFKKLAWFFKLRYKSYLFGVSALIICAILSAATPRILGNIIDQLASGSLTGQNLLLQTGIILLFAVIMYVLRYGWRTAIFGNSTLIESIMRNRLFSHFTQMDSVFFHKYRTGDLMAHATNDLAALRFVAGGGILTLTDSISIGAVTLFSMFVLIDWQLTLYTIIPFPLLIATARILGRQINLRYRGSLQAFSALNDQVQESVAGMKVIKSFGEETDEYADFVQQTDHVVSKNQAVYRVESAYQPLIQFVMGLTYVLTLFVGSQFIQSGRISLGDLIAYFSYLAMMRWPLLAVGNLVNTMERGNASYDRLMELLANESQIIEAKQPLAGPITGDVQVRIKHFAYPDSDQVALADFNLDLAAGRTLGLVGRTGAGKTTLFKLLLRQYDGYEGTIKFDQNDIKEYSLAALAAAIGFVPQDNFLFSATIRENISFGNPALSQEQVEYFARLTDIHEDILAFPAGYDTKVGERGVSLSGGQKQRIAIARALALNPEYLILDDSLSAVDAQTEERILTNLKANRENKTTIIAAHRISSIMHADEIIVVDEGRIIERGVHEELMALQGWYYDMYQQQQLEQKLGEGGA